VFTFYLGCGADQRLVDRIKVDRKLFEEMKRIGCLGGADTSFDNIEKLAPVNPI
jgi:hypothetical protein